MKWKLILVPFPFDNMKGSKVRPAICLTNEIGPFRHIIIAFITSQVVKAKEKTDILILPNDPSFVKTELKRASSIQLHRLVSIPNSMIQRHLGIADLSIQIKVEQNLRTLFGL